ncbi:cation:proton antiporter [Elusimicrobiota bacterium]
MAATETLASPIANPEALAAAAQAASQPLMPDAGTLLLMLGLVLYVGVVGSYIFERFKIPDVLNLILIGLILGPVLHLIDPGLLTPWMPVVGAVALSLILFEGGLGLELKNVIKRFGMAFLMATGSFLLTASLIAVAYRVLAGAAWIPSLLLGSTLGCVSSAVILPISNLIKAPEHVKTTIDLESALSDMWGVVLTLVLMRLAPMAHVEAGYAFNAIIGAFTTAIVAGGAFGMIWLWALYRLRESQFAYMMTLAAVFVLYGLTELVHGSGPMAALTFGAVLSNADQVARLFGKRFLFVLDDKIRWFNTEVTFFARTFFFVYLGLVVSFGAFKFSFLLMLVYMMIAILVSRWAIVSGAVKLMQAEDSKYKMLYFAMLPRGLTSAVLVGMVEARVPGTDGFMEYAFAIILLTNILMTWWVYKHESGPSDGARGEADGAKGDAPATT